MIFKRFNAFVASMVVLATGVVATGGLSANAEDGKLTFSIEEKTISVDELTTYETTKDGDYIVPVAIYYEDGLDTDIASVTIQIDTNLEFLPQESNELFADLICNSNFTSYYWDCGVSNKTLVYLDPTYHVEKDGVAVSLQLIVPKNKAVAGAKFPVGFNAEYENLVYVDDKQDIMECADVNYVDGYIEIVGEGSSTTKETTTNTTEPTTTTTTAKNTTSATEPTTTTTTAKNTTSTTEPTITTTTAKNTTSTTEPTTTTTITTTTTEDTSSETETTEPEFHYDVNEDGQINVIDLLVLKKILLGIG